MGLLSDLVKIATDVVEVVVAPIEVVTTAVGEVTGTVAKEVKEIKDEMNDCDWVAAETKEEAIQCLAELLGDKPTDKFIEDNDIDPEVVSDERMLELKHNGEDGAGPVRTFREELDSLIKDGTKFPMHFASTEY
jgi:hypothetical protein